MNKKINKITFNPPIKGYLGYALPLGILFAENQKFLPWMYSNHNYIMMSGKKDFSSFNQSDNDWMHGIEGVFKKNFVVLPKYILDRQDIIISLIIDLLENGSYILADLNEYYVPQRRAYMKRNFDHVNMLYGFDKTRNVFYIASYTDKGYYGGTEIAFDEYIISLKNSQYTDFTLNVVTPSNDFEPKFNLDRCKILLGYYLTGNDKEYDLGNDDYYHGIDAVKNLYYYLEHVKHNDLNIDIRYFYYLWEHKKIMFDRINYMIDNNYISGNIEHYKDYSDIVRKSEIMKGLALKYNFTKSKTTLENMQDLIHFIVYEEEKILKDIIKDLK